MISFYLMKDPNLVNVAWMVQDHDDSKCEEDGLVMAWRETTPAARYAKALDSSTPAEFLTKLAEDRDLIVRLGVALNCNTFGEVLRDLAKDESFSVRYAVASNSNTPYEARRDLAKDERLSVLCAASDPNTPRDVLRDLAKDERLSVRRAVASNPSTPYEVLREFAYNASLESSGIIKRLLQNPSTTEELRTVCGLRKMGHS